MKNLLTLMMLVLFTSCNLFSENDDKKDDDKPDPITVGGTKTFTASNTQLSTSDPNYYYTLKAVLAYSNSKVDIFVEESNKDKVTQTAVISLADEFKNVIYPKVTNVYGAPSDVDGNGKISILLLDIQDGYNEDDGGGFIAGYFNPYDLLQPSQIAGKSNEQEMFYIDCVQQNPDGFAVKSILVYEFQHMIQFNQRHFVKSIPFNKQGHTWLQESLAEQASYETYGQNGVHSRFNFFSNNSFNETHSLIHWESSLSNYALAATFMNYLSNKMTNKNTFLKNAQYQDDGGVTGLSELLTTYSGTGTEKFKNSFIDYAVNGLYNKTGFPGIKGSFSFGGVQETTSFGGKSFKGFSPVFLKYDVDQHVTNSSSTIKLVDIGSGSLTTSQTIDSVSAYNSNSYGVILAYYDELSSESGKNFSLPMPNASRQKKSLLELPKSYPVFRSVPKIEIR